MATLTQTPESPSRTLPAREHQPMIVVFGSDRDLCESLCMLFQERYHVVVPRDFDQLDEVLHSGETRILLVDIPPSQRLTSIFSLAKTRQPDLKIILFFASHFNEMTDHASDTGVWQFVDTVLFKPVELDSVIRRIDELAYDKPA